MQITHEERKNREEIVKKLDFLAELRKIINLDGDENLEVEVTVDPKTRRFDYEVKNPLNAQVKEKLNDMVKKGSDGKTIIDEIMKLKEQGIKFGYQEATSLLETPAIEEFRTKYKALEASVVKTRVMKAMHQKDLEEATKIIVDLIYRGDAYIEEIIASTLNDFKAPVELKRKIMDELRKDERTDGYILRYWSKVIFKDINITDGRGVAVNKTKSFNSMESIETISRHTDAHDDLDLQADSNILKDGGINALMTYLQENDVDERSFNIGDLDEILERFKDVKLIKYVDFVNRLERIATGEIEDNGLNKKEFKSKDIDEKMSKNDIYVTQICEQIGDKYYVTRDVAMEILNLSSIQTFKEYYKLLSQNIDKIRIRSILEKADVDEEQEILISLIKGNGSVKLESVLNELVMYTEIIKSVGVLDKVYDEAKKRCKELFVDKKDVLKDLVERMNKDLLKDSYEKRIDTSDIEDMFTSDDDKIENRIIQDLEYYVKQNGNKEARYALSEINYMEKIGDLLNQFEINITIPKIRKSIKELAYEEDKDTQANEIVKLIVELGKEDKTREAILSQLMDLKIDSKLQTKIDILLEQARDNKKMTPKEHIEWIRDIIKISRQQRQKGLEI